MIVSNKKYKIDVTKKWCLVVLKFCSKNTWKFSLTWTRIFILIENIYKPIFDLVKKSQSYLFSIQLMYKKSSALLSQINLYT